MFVNFNRAFNNNKREVKIPEVILQYMSDKLPEGLQYVQIDRDTCGIMSKDNELSITVPIEVPSNIKLNDNTKLMEYLYRTQTELEIKSEYIKINGNRIKVSEMFIRPLAKNDFEGGCFVIRPEPFPGPIKLTVGCQEFNIEFEFERQPYANMNKMLFKSINNNIVEISYIIDEIKMSLSVNIKLHLSNAVSAEEVVYAYKIYKAFKSGTATLGNMEINTKSNDTNDEIYKNIDGIIEFWNRVDELGKNFKVLFKPKQNLNQEDYLYVQKLYKSLIEDKTYKEFATLNNILVTLSEEDNDDKLIPEFQSIQYIEQVNLELMNVNLDIWSVITWFDIKVIEKELIDSKKNLFKLSIGTTTDKGMYKVVKHFKTKEEAIAYRENISNEIENLTSSEVIQ